jgi:hypothetical protein
MMPISNISAFSVYLSTASHHLDILLFEVRCGIELAYFNASMQASMSLCHFVFWSVPAVEDI